MTGRNGFVELAQSAGHSGVGPAHNNDISLVNGLECSDTHELRPLRAVSAVCNPSAVWSRASAGAVWPSISAAAIVLIPSPALDKPD